MIGSKDIALAVHSMQMEGGAVSVAFTDDARDYARGLIDPAELVTRTRRCYGLEGL
ncbi:hypothetical protein BMIN_0231 [Bifidobacterium minimum]|uniref:Antitoxin VbhA domain-containing protein n=1 Tax=Bifidobacterium minimum TaxID=1693 RepID=A0A087BMT9_9BIFI|nr:hypothetical protein [Bifidobacterium minimum]KFI72339.1 hypothetical protein BMIN_0231 [Bifidobacterium minimum]